MAVTYYVALPFIRTDEVPRQVKHRSAQAKLPRSGGPKNVTRSCQCGGGRIQACRRSERWQVFGRGRAEESLAMCRKI